MQKGPAYVTCLQILQAEKRWLRGAKITSAGNMFYTHSRKNKRRFCVVKKGHVYVTLLLFTPKGEKLRFCGAKMTSVGNIVYQHSRVNTKVLCCQKEQVFKFSADRRCSPRL